MENDSLNNDKNEKFLMNLKLNSINEIEIAASLLNSFKNIDFNLSIQFENIFDFNEFLQKSKKKNLDPKIENNKSTNINQNVLDLSIFKNPIFSIYVNEFYTQRYNSKEKLKAKINKNQEDLNKIDIIYNSLDKISQKLAFKDIKNRLEKIVQTTKFKIINDINFSNDNFNFDNINEEEIKILKLNKFHKKFLKSFEEIKSKITKKTYIFFSQNEIFLKTIYKKLIDSSIITKKLHQLEKTENFYFFEKVLKPKYFKKNSNVEFEIM